MENTSGYSIIPTRILSSTVLTPNEKLLIANITTLTEKEGYCFATNKAISTLIGVSESTIVRGINKLIKLGFIISEIYYKKEINGIEKHGTWRRIYVNMNPGGGSQNDEGGVVKMTSQSNNTQENILSKDNSTKYGNEDINKFIQKINSLLEVKLPEDAKARMMVSNMLKLLSRHEKRLWLKESKWDNAKDWFDQYHQTSLVKGFYPRSWYKVYDNLKLWIANEGDLSKLNKK